MDIGNTTRSKWEPEYCALTGFRGIYHSGRTLKAVIKPVAQTIMRRRQFLNKAALFSASAALLPRLGFSTAAEDAPLSSWWITCV